MRRRTTGKGRGGGSPGRRGHVEGHLGWATHGGPTDSHRTTEMIARRGRDATKPCDARDASEERQAPSTSQGPTAEPQLNHTVAPTHSSLHGCMSDRAPDRRIKTASTFQQRTSDPAGRRKAMSARSPVPSSRSSERSERMSTARSKPRIIALARASGASRYPRSPTSTASRPNIWCSSARECTTSVDVARGVTISRNRQGGLLRCSIR
jgi:hypothetical protein